MFYVVFDDGEGLLKRFFGDDGRGCETEGAARAVGEGFGF